MTATLPPLMARLARRRTLARITQTAIAAFLGVDRATVSRWEALERSPHYLYAVGYAHRVWQQIILRDGPDILAADDDIPARLPRLRVAAGLSQTRLAPILHVTRQAVTAAEARGYQLLASVETGARGLGYAIDLQAYRPARLEAAA
jgi:transcriptional regulator with XRE-family HTH domain